MTGVSLLISLLFIFFLAQSIKPTIDLCLQQFFVSFSISYGNHKQESQSTISKPITHLEMHKNWPSISQYCDRSEFMIPLVRDCCGQSSRQKNDVKNAQWRGLQIVKHKPKYHSCVNCKKTSPIIACGCNIETWHQTHLPIDAILIQMAANQGGIATWKNASKTKMHYEMQQRWIAFLAPQHKRRNRHDKIIAACFCS